MPEQRLQGGNNPITDGGINIIQSPYNDPTCCQVCVVYQM